MAITVTNAGYIKRTPVTAYSRQGRGGKGRFGAKAKDEDFVEHLFTASTHDYLMIFTDNGQVFKIKVHEIPEGDTAARGKAIVNLVQLSGERKLVEVMPVRDFAEEVYVTMVTKQGVIKKSSLSEYQNIRANGINAINIDEGDELLDVFVTDGTKQIFIATHDGMAIRFDETDARPLGQSRSRRSRHQICEKAISSCRLVPFQKRNRENAFDFRTGLRQTDESRNLPLAVTRRQRRHQYENDEKDRQGRRRFPG